MSVSKMKKLTVFAHKSEEDVIIKRLLRLRCLDVTASVSENDFSTLSYNCDKRRGELQNSIDDIDAAMVELNKYSKRGGGLFKSKTAVCRDKFVKQGLEVRARATVSRTLEILSKESALKNEISNAEALITSAYPYREHDLPLGFRGTASSQVILGALPSSADITAISGRLDGVGVVLNVLLADNTGIYISVICHTSSVQEVSAVLGENGFVRASFKGVRVTAKTYGSELRGRIAELKKASEELHAELVTLADDLGLLETLYDVEASELNATEMKQKMLTTGSTVMLRGWFPADAESKIDSLLSGYSCAYEMEEPTEEDNPPILLKNNGFASNFEWVLGMYSYPAYGKFDPTFIMSICYFIIFGIMFADAGYGLILVLAGFGAVKLLKPSESMERFLKMFAYCGISCIFFGVLFGAYFGDLPIAFMKNMLGMTDADIPNLALLGGAAPTLAVLFDPLQNPMAFLVFSLAVGAVHLIAGMAVKFYVLCRDGRVLDAVLDIGAYWLLFAGIGLLVLLPAVGKWVVIAAVAIIVLTHGRAEKNIVMKLAKGLLGLYDLINYASDLLSYSRILALGLAAGVIAQVVNILGTMGGLSVGGIIVLIAVFIVGHLLNLVINVLGTFVHTSRLQYIEFFNKFYEDGGIAFEPSVPSDKYTTDDGSDN